MMGRTLWGLGPLYHSYRLFGVNNEQRPEYAVNQRVKEPIILGHIALALGKSRRSIDDAVSFAELFCADGYYAMLAAWLGASPSVGIDNDRDGFSKPVTQIARRLGLSVEFARRDVNDLNESDVYDVVANVGGLYHVRDPIDVLRKSWALARRYLIVQSVVSLANEGADYLEAPAPGWTHGSRFSADFLFGAVRAEGYRVIDSSRNVLEGNERPEDRGSVYMLIEKRPA
ncbi:MAG TPA: methyltransferase domain-containing protein [Candidatus Binatia bacterium]|nr:methyltransferase domain-containing protein [Candidatus Binatia bacterium]